VLLEDAARQNHHCSLAIECTDLFCVHLLDVIDLPERYRREPYRPECEDRTHG
jgi:hypothetical protein